VRTARRRGRRRRNIGGRERFRERGKRKSGDQYLAIEETELNFFFVFECKREDQEKNKIDKK
jgi:hypothetical protein